MLEHALGPALEPASAFSLVLRGEGDAGGDSDNSSSAVATFARPRDQRWALHRPYPQEWGSPMRATRPAVAPFDVVGACLGGWCSGVYAGAAAVGLVAGAGGACQPTAAARTGAYKRS